MEQRDLDLLQTIPAYHLQVVIKARHLPISSKLPFAQASSDAPLHTPATQEIAHHLFDPPSIAEALNSLSEGETLLLRELVACGGRANSRDLAFYCSSVDVFACGKEAEVPVTVTPFALLRGASYASSASVVPQYPVAHPHGTFELAIRHLLMLGLLFWGKQTHFDGQDYGSGMHDGVLLVPHTVREVARRIWNVQEEQPLVSRHEEVTEGARALQRALYLYWSLVASMREGLGLQSNGLLSRSSLRRVVEQMQGKGSHESLRQESDVPRLLFIRLLLMQLGLLQKRNNTLHVIAAESFFALPLLERARRCYRLYLETAFWNEFPYLPEVNVRPGPSPLEPAHEEIVHARQTVIERVQHEHEGVWSTLATFIARSKLHAPYLLFPRHYGSRTERYSSGNNPYSWDFRLRRGWLTHREGWHMVEGGFIRSVLSGPLCWLGLVEVDHEEHPTSFCLASGAMTIMSDTPAQTEETPRGRLIVQPNFEIVALAPISEVLLIALDRFAERISLEHIAQYRVTKASITRAIQMGLHAETIQQQLEQEVGGEIPQNVRYSLLEWERQVRRVEVWPAVTLLEVEDEALLDALFANQATCALLGRRLSAKMAEVAPQQLPAVQEILWLRDYLPALTSAPIQERAAEHGRQATCEKQWQLHPDGLLQPLYAVSNLYLIAEVEHFSERDDDTGWYRITQASIQSTRANAMPLEEILYFLQQYCEDGIPASLLMRIKLWGDGYSKRQTVHVEHAPLLRLSEQVLQDVQADEELKELLGADIATESRLVHVDTSHLARVLELLRERGFTVE